MFSVYILAYLFLSGNLREEKPISLQALNGCECPFKDKCPELDKRSLFYNTNTEGCTVLKANLVKVCDSVTEELYRITCINGRKFHPVELNKKR